LAYLNDCITTRNSAAPASDWLSANAWLSAMAEESGSNPNLEKERPSSSPSPGTPNPQLPQRFNLLLAEDNLPDALLVREVVRMESLPLDIHIAADGQRAIEFIANAEADPQAPCPHLLLLDLNLPKRDGFEVLRRLRASEKCRGIPVLIVTSSDAPSDQSQAAALGASYFRKPPNYEEYMKLGGVLKQLLKESGVL